MRRAHGVLRPKIESTGCVRGGLPCFNLSGPAEWRGQVSGRPSRACSRVVSLLSDCAHRQTARPVCRWLTVSEAGIHERISSRGASGEIWTARRAWDAEVSGDESEQALASGKVAGAVVPSHIRSAAPDGRLSRHAVGREPRFMMNCRGGMCCAIRANRPSSIAFPTQKTLKVDGSTRSPFVLDAAMRSKAHRRHANGVGQTGLDTPIVRRSHKARSRACIKSCSARTIDTAALTLIAIGRNDPSGFQR